MLTLPIKIGLKVLYHNFIIVATDSFPGSVLIGTDFLKRLYNVAFQFDQNSVSLNNMQFSFLSTYSNFNSNFMLNNKLQCTNITTNVNIRPQCASIMSLPVSFPEGTEVLFEGVTDYLHISISNSISKVKKGKILIGAVNSSSQSVILNKENATFKITPNDEFDIERQIPDGPETGAPDLTHLTHEQQLEIEKILNNNNKGISKNETDIGYCNKLYHQIDTGNHPPIATRQWPLPHSTKLLMKEECDKMLKMKVIEPCNSPWRSPCLIIKKRNNSYRYCIDFRSIKAITKEDNYPLPRIETILESMSGAQYFSTLDMRCGYWQIPIAPEDREKAAFTTPDNTYCFKRLPFGLNTAPATFQRVMTAVLSPILGVSAFVFLDDVIVFSSTFEEHIKDLDTTMKLITNAGLKLSIEKCTFAKTSLKFLGHIVSSSGIKVDPQKVAAMSDMAIPRCKRDVKRFIGMTSYNRRFVPNFSALSASLTALTKKDAKFVWGDVENNAFQSLKSALTSTPVLIYPDFQKPFQIHTDASNIAIGAALLQECDGINRPVAYFSRKLNSAEINYTVTEREALAIVAAVKHFSHYIFGYKCQIFTDHAPLRFLFENKATVPRITRWAVLLSQFDFEIIYVSGKLHHLPDSLSRLISNVNVNSEKQKFDPAQIFDSDIVRNEQMNDATLKDLIAVLEGNSSSVPLNA